MINIGPQPNGEIPSLAKERLKGMGEWLKQYGETIYGTRAGTVKKAFWGTTTSKDNKLYVHILSDAMPQYITLPLNEKVVSAITFDTKENVPFQKIKDGIVLYTKHLQPAMDKIIILTIKK